MNVRSILVVIVAVMLTACSSAGKKNVSGVVPEESLYLSEPYLQVKKHSENSHDLLADLDMPEKTFMVAVGTLRSNVERITSYEGYNLAHWKGDDFPIHVPYPITYRGVKHGLSQLLEKYPLQSQLIIGTQNLLIVERRLKR